MGGSSKRPSSQTLRCQRPTGSIRDCRNLPVVNEPWSSAEGRKQFSHQPVLPLACGLKFTVCRPSGKTSPTTHICTHTEDGLLQSFPILIFKIKREVNGPGKLTEMLGERVPGGEKGKNPSREQRGGTPHHVQGRTWCHCQLGMPFWVYALVSFTLLQEESELILNKPWVKK